MERNDAVGAPFFSGPVRGAKGKQSDRTLRQNTLTEQFDGTQGEATLGEGTLGRG
jgi:hypothetical protein